MVFLGKRGRGWKESRGLLAALCDKTMRVSGCSAPGVGMQMKRRGLKEGFHPHIVEVRQGSLPSIDPEVAPTGKRGWRSEAQEEALPRVLQEVLCGERVLFRGIVQLDED